MKVFKFLFIFVSVFFNFLAENMPIPADFVHCATGLTKEQAILNRYPANSTGRTKLRTDLQDIIELRLADGFLTSTGVMTKSDMETQVSLAIKTILGTNIGEELFKTLVTKLTLRKEAIYYIGRGLQRYKQNVDKNCMLAAAGTLYRLARYMIHGATGSIADVNQVIDYFSSQDNFKTMISQMIMQNDWETKSDSLISAPEPTKAIGDLLDEDYVLLSTLDVKNLNPITKPYLILGHLLDFLGMCLNATKIRITNEAISYGHCFYMSPTDGALIINIHFSSFQNHPLQIFHLPTVLTPHATATVTRTFDSIPTAASLAPPLPTEVIAHTTLGSRSIVDLDELLFHELGHCLHTVEGRVATIKTRGNIEFKFQKNILPYRHLLQTDLTPELTGDWINPEEFRNATGIVLMTDGSLRKDAICTYVYDKQRARDIRWPYRNQGSNTTAVDFVQYIQSIHP